MEKRMTRFWRSFLSLLITTAAFADNTNLYEPLVTQGCDTDCCGFTLPLPCHPPVCAYNAADVIDTFCPYDVIVSATYLYWQAMQEGLEIGHTRDQTTDFDFFGSQDAPRNQNSDIIFGMNFKYSSGFKVSLGTVGRGDDWEVNVRYTHLEQTATGSASVSNQLIDTDNMLEFSGIEAYWSFLDSTSVRFQDANATWDLRMKHFDFELARSYFVGKYLTFRTCYGIRLSKIKQNYQAHYSGLRRPESGSETPFLNTTFNSDSTSSFKSWGAGPRAGLNTSWKFFSGMRLYGNVAGALLYTEYEQMSIESTLAELLPLGITVNEDSLETAYQNNPFYLRAQLDFELGWGWGAYLCSNRFYVDLTVGYSCHTFWDQNILPAYPVVTSVSQNNVSQDRVTSRYLSTYGNLYVHGLDVGLSVQF